MFQKARLKLTVWYLLIIMLISMLFSAFIYKALTFEYDRILKMEQLRQEGQIRTPTGGIIIPFQDDISKRGIKLKMAPNTEVINEAKDRLLNILIMVNLGILLLAGGAGYFLAGRTLRPIKEMIDEQNRFITDTSHEIRTPLTSLKSEIEVSLRDKSLRVENYKKILESNLEEVNKLQYLSDNLIKLTQYQKVNGFFFEEVSLNEVTQDVLKKVSGLARNKKIMIKSEIKDLKIEADKQKLTELLVILSDNAIKYSSNNTVISLSCKKERNFITIIIKDQGIGISEEEIPHLFDRFYRGDRSRSKINASGYGLGLSIAKQIVEKHQGSVKVISKVGSGTSFQIHLPIKQSNATSNF